ncbi:MAG: saccharopine dehydrogenase NADP-binding domain-containing protein [Pacificimonas sp.]
MSGDLIFYGAYGYTGRLVTERAVQLGLSPVLAGRDAAKVERLADEHGLRWRAFDAGDAAAELGDAAAVLNMAGPFSQTAMPMVDACLATGTHYVDITGEISVFEALHARDNEAGAAGVVLLPGAGFDVVPSDCLAAHVARKLPGATSLQLVIGGLNQMSRGTAKTGLESIAAGTKVRRGGKIVTLEEAPRGTADLGHGLKGTVGVGWGDVATAYYSTGVPDIDVFFEASPELERMAGMSGLMRGFMGSALGQWLGRKAIDRMPAGPDADTRETARGVMLAEVWDDAGGHAAARLDIPEGYKLTSMTALEAVRRVAAGDVAAGYRTPSTAFGPDFIMGFQGVSRSDL